MTVYIKKEIKTEADLPKIYGRYFVYVKDVGMDIFDWCQIIKEDAIDEYYSNEEQKEYWLNTFDWYLCPAELPTEAEIDKAVKELGKESTAPDTDTPNWLEADIRSGINWLLNRLK